MKAKLTLPIFNFRTLKNPAIPALATGLLFSVGALAQGAFSVSWDVTSVGGLPSEVPGIVDQVEYDGLITAANLERGGTASPYPTTGGSFATAGWQPEQASDPGEDPVYLEMGLQLAPGVEISWDSISYWGAANPDGPRIIAMWTSVDDYSSPINFIQNNGTQNWQGGTTEVELPAAQSITGNFNVRWVQFLNDVADGSGNVPAPDGTFSLGNAPVRFNGTVLSIPEPGANVLMLLGGVMLFGYIQRRRK